MKWETYKLKQLCSEIVDCVNKTAPTSDVPTPYKMLRTSDIREGKINLENLNCVTKEVYEKWTRRGKLQKGDVIFTREAPLGEVGLVREEKNYFLGQRLVLFRANNKMCDGRFLMYSLLWHDNKQAIISKGVGSTVAHLRVPECENIEIKVPDLDVQHRIADILSAYDDLIENNQKQIKLLEEAAQRLYKEWFVDLRFPGHENTKIVDGVPEGWRVASIADICDTVGGGTPSTKIQSYYEKGDILWVTPTDITRNFSLALLDTEKKITPEGLKNSSAKMLPAETILMTSRASVGFFGMCKYEVCTNQGFISCIPKRENLQMYLLFNLKSRVEEIRQKAGGSTYLEISKTVFRELKIILPKDEVLAEYQKNVHDIFDEIYCRTEMIKSLVDMRNRVLPKLMSGEVEV